MFVMYRNFAAEYLQNNLSILQKYIITTFEYLQRFQFFPSKFLSSNTDSAENENILIIRVEF